MPALTLKDLSEELYARLEASAERNRRSLNDEILACLESGFAAPRLDLSPHSCEWQALMVRLPRADQVKVSRYKRRGRA